MATSFWSATFTVRGLPWWRRILPIGSRLRSSTRSSHFRRQIPGASRAVRSGPLVVQVAPVARSAPVTWGTGVALFMLADGLCKTSRRPDFQTEPVTRQRLFDSGAAASELKCRTEHVDKLLGAEGLLQHRRLGEVGLEVEVVAIAGDEQYAQMRQ